MPENAPATPLSGVTISSIHHLWGSRCGLKRGLSSFARRAINILVTGDGKMNIIRALTNGARVMNIAG